MNEEFTVTDEEKHKILSNFIGSDGRLKSIPAQLKKTPDHTRTYG